MFTELFTTTNGTMTLNTRCPIKTSILPLLRRNRHLWVRRKSLCPTIMIMAFNCLHFHWHSLHFLPLIHWWCACVCGALLWYDHALHGTKWYKCMCKFNQMNEGRDVIICNQCYCIMQTPEFAWTNLLKKLNERK